MGYVTGGTIRILREKRKLTQKELAEIIHVSDKTISKWETDKGLPDISMIDELARALGVSIAELLTGDLRINENGPPTCKEYIFMSVLSAAISLPLWDRGVFPAVGLRCQSRNRNQVGRTI